MPFGGLNAIFVGDFFQLKPVRGHFVFKDTYLWPLFKCFVLNENVRQCKDQTYASLLNRIRIGAYTDYDIHCLKQRIVQHSELPNPTMLHIFPTKAEVDAHNALMQQSLPSITCTFTAIHSFSNNDIGSNATVPEEYIPPDDRDAGGLLRHLHLSTGTKVMLLRNLNVDIGLVNGAIGTVMQIPCMNASDPCVMVQFSDICVPAAYLNENNCVSIPLYEQEYLYKGRYIIRTNFPLMPCWATTIHKVQGLTLHEAAISIGSSVFEKGQAYVALSRVSSMRNVYILSFCQSKLICDPDVVQEYLRIYML